MLSAEQSRAALQGAGGPAEVEKQVRRVLRLRGDQRQVGRGLLAYQLPPAERVAWDYPSLGEALDGMPRRRRAKVFNALHPRLAGPLELAWSDLVRDPYTLGYTRKPFRAPNHPRVSAAARAAWLNAVASATGAYQQDMRWFATWAGHIQSGQPQVGRLLAVAIDAGDITVFDTLVATVRGAHEIAQMGRHVPAALLACGRPEGWDEVTRLLLAAQRQEGLRQVILETVDLAHHDAFQRMLRVVLDEGLARFAGAIRAVGVWFGASFEVRDRKIVEEVLSEVASYLSDDAARDAALRSEDPGKCYLALWALGFNDAPAASDAATVILSDSSPHRRLAAARILDELQLSQSATALLAALTDDDLRVAAIAFQSVRAHRWDFGGRALEPLLTLLERLGQQATVPVGLWKPEDITLSAADVADAAVTELGGRPATDVRGIVDRMSPSGRAHFARLLAEQPKRFRSELLDLAGDRSDYVRDTVFHAISNMGAPTSDEVSRLEPLLQRKSAGLRRSVMQLLLAQDDDAAAASAKRLLAGDKAQRQAAVELVAALKEQGRAPGPIEQLSADIAQDERVAPADREAVHAASVTSRPAQFEDIIDDAARTPAKQPRRPDVDPRTYTRGIERALRSLDAWLAEHRDVEVTVAGWQGTERQLVSNLRWLQRPAAQPWDAQRQRFPLELLLEPWWERTAGQLTDGGVEVLLAWPAGSAAGTVASPQPYAYGPARPQWTAKLVRDLAPVDVVASLQHAHLAVAFLAWFAVRGLRRGWVDTLLDAGDAALAAVPPEAIKSLPTVAQLAQQRWGGGGTDAYDWRGAPVCDWFEVAKIVEAARPDLWSSEQRARLWRQARFVDEPQGVYRATPDSRDELPHRYASMMSQRLDVPRRPARRRPPLELTTRAVAEGIATRSDMVELLVGERTTEDDFGQGTYARQPLGELTRRRRPAWVAEHEWLVELVEDIRGRVVATETARGELPTPMTPAATQLRSVSGCDVAVRLLTGLGRQRLVRGYIWRGDSKPEVFSKLIRVSFPAESETLDDFRDAVRRHGASEQRLLELAVYAPQWAHMVEAALGWDGLTEAVYWLHAHTKDTQWQVDEDIRAVWVAEAHQRTPLSAEDLVEGAVDVEWLSRIRRRLGDERFDILLKAAKYASSSGGHKRAELSAKAVRGDVHKRELIQRMTDKRHQDAVRALGLLPLPDEDTHRRAEVLARYQALQDWRRGSSRFGQQRRASEALAVRVAMDNLARNAGYRDPQRLQWAMESEAVQDLARGPISIAVDDVNVSLSIDASGNPSLEVLRGDRSLKSVPAPLRKHEGISALKDRAAALRDQARRMRHSLEEASIRGDRFTPDEFRELFDHPVLAPMLERLIVVTDEGVIGMPRSGGGLLLSHSGENKPPDGSAVRLAHPTDLLHSTEWHQWQRACFEQRVQQPFKQVFRELYVPTAAELDGAGRSERYAGHQIQPRQASALFGSRGWVVDRDSGALRTFHDERITVHVDVLGVWGTPAEVEDLTLEGITFTPVGEWEPIPISDVPPRLFSEAMRDVDLVVSVAHAGGVDPEASASTVEMRGALVRETADMLSLGNVELTDHHALIQGTLGTYSVHLGSGSVHRRPGNALCIIPVAAQHRGRIFLPFADDDPRTAEVLSKVVLLARDEKIKDPTILEQLST